MTDDVLDLVERSLAGETQAEFERRLDEQAAWLREAIAAGRFDSADFAVGLEMEAYAVESADEPRLARLPEEVFETPGANKELGLHNVEVNTAPTVLDGAGLAAQADEIAERTRATRDAVGRSDRTLVLDAVWTVPPAGGSRAYLSDVAECDGFTVAANMRPDPRYVAIDNAALSHAGGEIDLAVPGAEASFPSILFESLATSIQPHLQVPTAAEFPAHYNAAIRTLGPVLALATNSPFLPGDLYDADDPAALVDATHHELRIAVFEQSVNQTESPKVRVPGDIDDPTEVVDRVLADDLYAPFLREWVEDGERSALEDRIWEFGHKRGTYWRWLRCVIGGDYVDADNDEHSLRIEYRPLPTQPTVADVVGFQALVAGLVRGVVVSDHPLAALPREAAEACFYDVARRGLDADLAWLTADGERTADPAVVYEEVFALAREGLVDAGVPPDEIEEYLRPVEVRWEARATPSAWKKARVHEALADGADLDAAIRSMQTEYVRLSLESDSFAEWV